MSLRSELNAEVPVASPGEFSPLALTDELLIQTPVVLAPMAGVTNPPYRSLCRRMGAGLYVAEMVHARGLGERNAQSLRIASFAPEESLRSIQLFGGIPEEMGAAARFLVEEVGVHHLDVNMGCPVRKVTGRGAGSALPLRPRLMRAVVRAVVRGAGAVPVTVKIRLGLDDDHHTWPDALDVAEGEGCRWIGVHARTAQALYSGRAQWEWIARMKARARIPVLGNGDIWECWDALRMMRSTGCDGVIIGRGCLGRPWLFRELAAVFAGEEPADPPRLGEVIAFLHEHAALLVDHFGERKGMLEMRKWAAWYTKGFDGAGAIRERLQALSTLSELDAAVAELEPDTPFPARALRVARGKRGGAQSAVHLPHGWAEAAAAEKEERALGGDAPERPVDGNPDAPALHLPDLSFPPYRFVPGCTPHPFAHPDGWAYGKRPEQPVHVPAGRWAEDREYLRGLDFFNRGWWWEAHEAWEGIWHAAEGHDAQHRALLQALIQLAACALNLERGEDHHAAAGRLLDSALSLLEQAQEAAGLGVYCGLDLSALRADAARLLVAPNPRVDGLYLRVGSAANC